jgi:hypothetical protein
MQQLLESQFDADLANLESVKVEGNKSARNLAEKLNI